MFNVGGGELLVIFIVALIVLGPAKLPDAARQVGGAVRELKRLSSGFQQELRAAMDDPVEAAARDRGARVVASEQRSAPVEPEPVDDDDDGDRDRDGSSDHEEPHGADDLHEIDDDEFEELERRRSVSTAEAAGMYDLVAESQRSEPTPEPEPAGGGTGVDDPEAERREKSDEPEADDEAERTETTGGPADDAEADGGEAEAPRS